MGSIKHIPSVVAHLANWAKENRWQARSFTRVIHTVWDVKRHLLLGLTMSTPNLVCLVHSSASTNPDVLGSIFQNLDSLHSPGVQVARDGKLVKSTDQRSTKDVKNRDAKSASKEQKDQRCHTRLRLVYHFFVFTSFWRHSWPVS